MNFRLTPFLAFIISFFIVNNVAAQVTISPDYKFDIYNADTPVLSSGIASTLLYGTDSQIKQPLNYTNLTISSDTVQKAELIASNNNFDVYKLPMDNMRCLVPNKYFRGNMNTMKQLFNNGKNLNLYDKIPNALKKQDLIPNN